MHERGKERKKGRKEKREINGPGSTINSIDRKFRVPGHMCGFEEVIIFYNKISVPWS